VNPTNPTTSYLDRVRAALSDLPDGTREELLQDLPAHLDEVRAELGDDAGDGALAGRLGRPEDYAAELRSAAGLPPPAVASAAGVAPSWPKFRQRLARAAGSAKPGLVLADLRVIWWVLRGVLVAELFFQALEFWRLDRYDVRWLIFMVSVVLVACLVSLRLGRAGRRLVVLAIPLNMGLVAVLLFGFIYHHWWLPFP
jgi:hypothetical protein